MKITVFGSTGPTGIEVVKQALEAGYDVVAFARKKDKLRDLQHDRLHVVIGTLTDRSAIERAVTGVDAVISLLGPKGNVKNTELSDGVHLIIEVMKSVGINRLIALSTGSVKDKQDRFDLKYKILVTLIKTMVQGAYNEIVSIGGHVRKSRLDWTLVRVGFLNNLSVQPVKVGYYGHGVVKVKFQEPVLLNLCLIRSYLKSMFNNHRLSVTKRGTQLGNVIKLS